MSVSSASASLSAAPVEAVLAERADEWDALAEPTGSPCITSSWLSAWARERASVVPVCLTISGDSGELRAGAVFTPERGGGLASAGDELTGSWNAVARTAADRAELWRAVAARRPRRLRLRAVPGGDDGLGSAAAALADAGYGLAAGPLDQPSPYLELPDSFDALVASCSKNQRKDWRKRLRAAEAAGTLELRFGGPDVDRDLETFLAIEASGWKGRQRTALRSDPSAERMIRSFAHGMAERGWLRMAVLELDGEPISASLVTAIGGVASGIKAGYDEHFRDLAPGVLHHGAVLRACIEEEGIHTYDFLGAADRDKLRWTTHTRPLRTLVARPGPAGRSRAAVRNHAINPALTSVREQIVARPHLRSRLINVNRSVAAARRKATGR